MALHRSVFAAVLLAQLAHFGQAAGQAAPPAAQPAPDATNTDWPRQIDSVAGTIVVYQPQPESLQGTSLTGRAAFSLTPKGKNEPVFGALWFTANVDIDRDQRLVRVMDTKVTRVRLPDATSNDESAFAAEIEKEAPKWDITVPLDGLTAALSQVAEERAASDDLQAAPPSILFASEPTVLVVLDGQPLRRPIEKTGIDSVVNTPFPLFYDTRSQLFFLTNGAIWYQSKDLLKGPWQVIPSPPKDVSDVVMKGDKQDQSAPAPTDTAPAKILVTTTPTELIVTQGAANFAPLNGTQLLYVTNTEDNVFRDLASQKLFVVLSGRWYASSSFDGPWSFVRSDQLPPDFTRIPATSPKGDVLAFVSGTNQAKDAVMDAQIPQTAEVKRDAPGPTIQYDGQPNFQPIQGTNMTSAVNTPSSVLFIQGMYYACVDAVWYVGQGPQGPWAVATAVPQEVQTIPPSSPVYNVKYVTIYQATPQVVYVGYTPGYVGTYAWNGAVVYGTGYAYAPYISPVVYYPRPVTWGFGASYNPYTGWSYGVGVSAGFLYFGTRWGGSYYRPAWRPPYGGGWYGPGGYRPPPPRPPGGGGWYGSPGYRPPYAGGGYGAGYRPAYGGGSYRPPQASLYQRPANARAVVATRPVTPGNSVRPGAARPMPNNVYADKNGNVMRQTKDGNWQQRDNSTWKPAAPGNTGAPRPTPGTPSAGGRPAPTTPPQTRPAPSTPPQATRPAPGTQGPSTQPAGGGSRPAPSNIQGDYQARQRGNASVQNYKSTMGGGGRPAQPPKQQAPRPQAPKQSAPKASGGGHGKKPK
jgi:hypothetical protein